MSTELNATVEIKLSVPDSTDPSRITAYYLTAVLNDLIDTDEPNVEPFGFRSITATHVGMSTGDGTPRHHFGPDPDGFSIEAKLTDEGVIIDVFDSTSSQCVGTFARTYGEFIEGIVG